jgi:type IV secretion system protein VirB5
MIRFLSTVATCAFLVASPLSAQGVPTIDTRNIAQEIRQLQQMLEDFGIQTDQLDTLLEQLDLVQQQLDTLNETYDALTGATDIIEMAMGGDLDGLLDQEFGDLLGTIRQIQSGDFSGLIGNAAPQMEGRMTQALEDAGFDQDTLSDMASSGNPGAERIASQAGAGAVMSAAAENSYEEAAQSHSTAAPVHARARSASSCSKAVAISLISRSGAPKARATSRQAIVASATSAMIRSASPCSRR